jgi:hypothetical protein
MTKHHIVEHGTPARSDETRLTHAHCRRRHLADDGTNTSALPAREPSRGLLEPGAVQAARPVLSIRGAAMRPGYPTVWVAFVPRPKTHSRCRSTPPWEDLSDGVPSQNCGIPSASGGTCSLDAARIRGPCRPLRRRHGDDRDDLLGDLLDGQQGDLVGERRAVRCDVGAVELVPNGQQYLLAGTESVIRPSSS